MSKNPIELLEKWPQIHGNTNPASKEHDEYIKSLASTVKTLMDTVTTLQSKVTTLESEVKKLKEIPVVTTPSYASLFTPLYNSSKDNTSEAGAVVAANQRSRERMEEKRIERNVIISGIILPTGSSEEMEEKDKQEVTRVLTELGSTLADVKRFKRLIRKQPIATSPTSPTTPSRTPPILVEFNEANKRDKVCESAPQLRRKEEFTGIYLNADKTTLVRIAEQKQRDERNRRNNELDETDEQGRHFGSENGRKFYWAVRSGELKQVFLHA